MQTIGRYQLAEKLGQGGMGVVYRAYDELLERVVAVKVIATQLDSSLEMRERFFREARAAGQLSHKNIITIHDLGEQDGHPYLAMEYLEGQDLQRRLSGPEKMSLSHKVALAIEICEGLEYAHAHGVVHRDIKPANIFITDHGLVKILDFGLARLVSSQLTNSHTLMGTVNYMAPEQVRGERADQRSDVFSLAVVVYELLGGRKAFQGDSFASTLYKILQEVPEPLPKIDASLPLPLVAIVDRALAKPRDERYQTMSDLRRDLVGFRQVLSPASETRIGSGARPLELTAHSHGASTAANAGDGSGTAPDRAVPRGRARWALAAAGVVTVAVLSALWIGIHRIPTTPTDLRGAPVAPAASTADPRALADAWEALQAQDYASAARLADAALQAAPDLPEARQIRDRARESLASIETGLEKARALFAAGDYQEASRAAGAVLGLAPANAEANRIMEEGAARSRGRGAADARAAMAEARDRARAANAETLASAAFRAATRADQEAQRFYTAGRTADATTRFYVASGLYRSAALTAQAEAARARERAAAEASARAEQKPDLPATPEAPKPVEAQPAAPAATPPIVRPPAEEPSPQPPAAAATVPKVPAPPPQSLDLPPRSPAADDAIRDLLSQYSAALEAKNLPALKRIWPDLRGASEEALRSEFQHANRITVEIVEPRISVSAGSGSVTFLRRYELVTVEGQRLRTETITTMDVRHVPSGWVIAAVRFRPVR
jgi:serine/threonine-protein kinase